MQLAFKFVGPQRTGQTFCSAIHQLAKKTRVSSKAQRIDNEEI